MNQQHMYSLSTKNLRVFCVVIVAISLVGCPPRVNVPDCVGMTQAAAEAAITSANLAVGTITHQVSATVASGHVISQNPPAGSSVSSGTQVNLVVSIGEGTPEPVITVTVDPTLTPDYPSLPPLDGLGDDRPVAAIEDEFGHKANFISNELVLSTGDPGVLDTFLLRWDGELLMTLDPARGGLPIDPQYLVRIDLSLADTSRLIDDLHTMTPDHDGDHWVSSEEGLELLSAAAEEGVAGLGVGVNWVGVGADIDSRVTPEGLSGPNGYNSAGGGYSDNSFDWNHLDAGSTQDIGVTEAWWLLEQVGRLDNKVKIAILDGGFFETDDLPAGWVAISNVPSMSPMETLNPGMCGGPCPYHGTNVAGAAFGVVGNGFGGAGPAGPVAEPILVLTWYDYFTSSIAVIEALVLGAQILNMSYSVPVPSIVAWTVLPFEGVTAKAADTGNLLFASAGNDGDNVDGVDCFVVCWETAWHTPCENNGVICVGGLERDSLYKAAKSNYGWEHVDIFAPYRVLAGPDSASSGSDAQEKSGTSFSSPYAAGVAALIWAANPSLSADEVRNILFENGHIVPWNPLVSPYVNAYDAVVAALGSVIHIQRPADGDTVSASNLYFVAFVAEGGRGWPTVTWTSNVDGALGTGLHIHRYDLSYTTHTVTARAEFSDSFVTTDSITVTVTNDPPEVTITSSDNGASFFQGQTVNLTGTSYDANPLPHSLPDEQVSWYVDDGLLGTGHTQSIPPGTLSLESHTIRFDGTDGLLSGSDTISITINENPLDLPPDSVNITSPENNDDFWVDQQDAGGWYKEVTLEGNAHDPEDGDLEGPSLVWTTIINPGPTETVLGTGTSVDAKLYMPGWPYTHELTLTATDSAANESSASITVSVNRMMK